MVLHCLIGFQLLLGIEAWIGRFGSGVPVELQQNTVFLDVVRSGHFVIGTLLFATMIVVNLHLWHPANEPRALASATVALANARGSSEDIA
jgi:hypothetical protein